MSGVIATNSIVMSLELDIEWAGWKVVEHIFLVIYSFEMALRVKRRGCTFFVDTQDLIWNYLDLVMVFGGALDLWLMPLMRMLQALILGQPCDSGGGSGIAKMLQMLKMMRILRVLRLVRLLKMVKPLYRLLMGVMESFKAMQWVMILTFLTLYACAIVFTSLIGRGYMSGGEVSAEADQFFGSVSQSLFSLFKLMNGDTSVVEPITKSISGQLLFAGFMVIANWAILAILTSVVSDNMISSSAKANEEDEKKHREEAHEARVCRLKTLFREIDQDGSGFISTTEWYGMLEDTGLCHELCDATGLEEHALVDYFKCLSVDTKEQQREAAVTEASRKSDKKLDYNTFIESLKDEGTIADTRSILRLMSRLRALESYMETRFENLSDLSRPAKTRGDIVCRNVNLPDLHSSPARLHVHEQSHCN